MAESSGRTLVTSILFLDIVGYSKQSVADQLQLKHTMNDALAKAMKPIPPHERVLLDTGDGAAITFLGNPEDALFAGMVAQQVKDVPLRMGINLGPVRIVKDLNGQTNVLGDGINVGQRVMSFAGIGQLLVSRSFYEVVSRLSSEYENLFEHIGLRADKHVREHEVYLVHLDADGLPAFLKSQRGDSWVKAVGLTPPEDAIDPALADQPAQVFSTGDNYMVSGPTLHSVQAALDELARSGSRVLSPISKVGSKWMATCDKPDAADSANVESLGLTRIVTGPTRDGVAAKVDELVQKGARLVHDLAEANGMWTAVCEVDSSF